MSRRKTSNPGASRRASRHLSRALLTTAKYDLDKIHRQTDGLHETVVVNNVTRRLCPWPGCNHTANKTWACKQHWQLIPLKLRNLLWATWHPEIHTLTYKMLYPHAMNAIRQIHARIIKE